MRGPMMLPNRKVGASSIAASLSILLVWGIKEYGHTTLPPEVASATTALISFVVGYFVTEPD